MNILDRPVRQAIGFSPSFFLTEPTQLLHHSQKKTQLLTNKNYYTYTALVGFSHL